MPYSRPESLLVAVYRLSFALGGLLWAQSVSANLEKPVPQTAAERKFPSCLRAIHPVEKISLTPQQEALILAEERDWRGFSQLEETFFQATDSQQAQRIRAASAA